MKNWAFLLVFATACVPATNKTPDDPKEEGTPIGDPVDAMPSLTVTASATAGTAPLALTFAAAALGGDAPLTIAWTFGDGATGAGASVMHTFMAGNFTVQATVTDADGDNATASVNVAVAPANGSPSATLSAPVVCAGENASFALTAGGTDPEGEPVSYGFVIVSAPVGYTGPTGASGSSFTLEATAPGSYEVRSRASDGTNEAFSDTLTLTATNEPAQITLVSGGGQTAAVDGELAPITVQLATSCGTPVPSHRIYFGARNGRIKVGPGTAYSADTDNMGQASAVAIAGQAAGPALLRAFYRNVELFVPFTVTAGAAAKLVLAPIPRPFPINVAANVSTPPLIHTLSLYLTDTYYNRITNQDISFSLNASGLAFENAPGVYSQTSNSITTVNGEATANLYLVNATQSISNIVATSVPPGITFTALEEIPLGDFDGDNSQWAFGGRNWQIGAPTHGPGAAATGTNVLATQLDGNFVQSSSVANVDAAVRPFIVDLTRNETSATLQEVRVRYKSWFDFGPSEVTNQYTTEGGFTFDTCARAAGYVRLGASGNGFLNERSGAFPPECDSQNPPTYSENSRGSYLPSSVSIIGSFPDQQQVVDVFFGFVSSPTGTVGAGWFIDDVVAEAYTNVGAIVNRGSDPVSAVLSHEVPIGSVNACHSPAIVQVLAYDLNDTYIQRAGVRVSLSTPSEQTTITGAIFGSDYQQVTPQEGSALTDENGMAMFLITGSATGAVEIVGHAGPGSATGSVDFTDVAHTGELGARCRDGIDNDCDDAADCEDTECYSNAYCQGETCDNPISLGTRRLGHLWLGDLCTFDKQGGSSKDVTLSFQNSVGPSTYWICVEDDNPAGSNVSAEYRQTCAVSGVALTEGGCTEVTVESAVDRFVTLSVPAADCGAVRVSIVRQDRFN